MSLEFEKAYSLQQPQSEGGGEEINNQDIQVTENGVYTAEEGYTGIGTATVNVQPDLGTKSITANDTYVAANEGLDGYSSVTVNVQPNLISKTITENGTYLPGVGVDGYNEVIVNVPGMVEKTFTIVNKEINDNGYTYNADVIELQEGEIVPYYEYDQNMRGYACRNSITVPQGGLDLPVYFNNSGQGSQLTPLRTELKAWISDLDWNEPTYVDADTALVTCPNKNRSTFYDRSSTSSPFTNQFNVYDGGAGYGKWAVRGLMLDVYYPAAAQYAPSISIKRGSSSVYMGSEYTRVQKYLGETTLDGQPAHHYRIGYADANPNATSVYSYRTFTSGVSSSTYYIDVTPGTVYQGIFYNVDQLYYIMANTHSTPTQYMLTGFDPSYGSGGLFDSFFCKVKFRPNTNDVIKIVDVRDRLNIINNSS